MYVSLIIRGILQWKTFLLYIKPLLMIQNINRYVQSLLALKLYFYLKNYLLKLCLRIVFECVSVTHTFNI